MALLIVIAACIYVVIVSGDYMTRALFASIAVVVEILRDAYTLHKIAPLPTTAMRSAPARPRADAPHRIAPLPAASKRMRK